jgi:hypothetical protein
MCLRALSLCSYCTAFLRRSLGEVTKDRKNPRATCAEDEQQAEGSAGWTPGRRVCGRTRSDVAEVARQYAARSSAPRRRSSWGSSRRRRRRPTSLPHCGRARTECAHLRSRHVPGALLPRAATGPWGCPGRRCLCPTDQARLSSAPDIHRPTPTPLINTAERCVGSTSSIAWASWWPG